jgi:two-component system OmpR family response regulator
MKRVLVIEDDPQIQALVKRALERFEYDVQCVDDATTAAQAMSSRQPDLLLLDIMLPGDYLTKPFNPRELVARVNAVMRRYTAVPAGQNATDDLLSHGDLQVDVAAREVHYCGNHIELTQIEFELLRTLMQRPTHVLSRDQLMEGAYGTGTYVSPKTINTHMRHLRAKLRDAGPDPIESERSIGYRMVRLTTA